MTLILIAAWLVLGLGTILDQADDSGVYTSAVAIVADDNDDGSDDAKNYGMEAAIFAAPRTPSRCAIQALQQFLTFCSLPRYQLLSVYRV